MATLLGGPSDGAPIAVPGGVQVLKFYDGLTYRVTQRGDGRWFLIHPGVARLITESGHWEHRVD
jgi:hypothetical protein